MVYLSGNLAVRYEKRTCCSGENKKQEMHKKKRRTNPEIAHKLKIKRQHDFNSEHFFFFMYNLCVVFAYDAKKRH